MTCWGILKVTTNKVVCLDGVRKNQVVGWCCSQRMQSHVCLFWNGKPNYFCSCCSLFCCRCCWFWPGQRTSHSRPWSITGAFSPSPLVSMTVSNFQAVWMMSRRLLLKEKLLQFLSTFWQSCYHSRDCHGCEENQLSEIYKIICLLQKCKILLFFYSDWNYIF